MKSGRLTLLGLAIAASLAGCGGSGGNGADKGGFNATERKAAQGALDLLSRTAVATTAIQNTGVSGYPTECSVHLEARRPLRIKLFLTWKHPKRPYYSWVQAVMGPDGLKRDYAFLAGNETSAAALKARIGDALSKPYQPCEITNIGTFAIIPFSLENRAHPSRRVQG